MPLDRQAFEHDMLTFLDRFDTTFVLGTASSLKTLNVTRSHIHINGFVPYFKKLFASEVFVSVNVTLEKHRSRNKTYYQTFCVFPIHRENQETLRINTHPHRNVYDSLGDKYFVFEIGRFFSGPQN